MTPNYECREFGTGGVITFNEVRYEYYHNSYKYHTTMFPAGVALDSYNYMFYDNYTALNGFGMYYVALFIISNYARYYPDLWISDIEHSSPLSLVVEELLNSATNEIPMLALSELARRYYVAEGLPLT